MALVGSPPRGEVEAWLRDAAVGDKWRVSYSDDTVDHERILIWPARGRKDGQGHEGEGVWWVLSPDGDCWKEDLLGRDPANGPEQSWRLDKAGRRRKQLYRFTAYPSKTKLKGLVVEPRMKAKRAGQGDAHAPADYVLADGTRGVCEDLVPMRRTKAKDDEDKVEEDDIVWVLTEEAGRHSRGHTVKLDGFEIRAGDKDALVLVGDEFYHVKGMTIEEHAEYLEKDQAKARREKAEQRTAAKPLRDKSPEPTRLDDDERGEDARTLWVEWDDHGERYRSFRSAVMESKSYDWHHPRLDGGHTCLHTCKMMERFGTTPRGWLERFLRENT